MNKSIYFSIATLAIVVCMTSCGTNPPIEPKPIADIKMYVNEQKELPAEYAPWVSANSFIAEVIDGTILVSHHAGDVQLSSKDSICNVTVESHYKNVYAPYDDPIMIWGITKKQLRDSLGRPEEADRYEYGYSSSDGKVRYIYYFDEEDQILNHVAVQWDNDAGISAELIVKMLEESYELVRETNNDPSVYRVYVNCWKEDYEKDSWKSWTMKATFNDNPAWMSGIDFIYTAYTGE